MVTEGFRRPPTEEDLNPDYPSGPGYAHKDPFDDEHWVEVKGGETLEELLNKLNFVKDGLKKKKEIREEKNIFKKVKGVVSNISISKKSREDYLRNALAEILLRIELVRTQKHREDRDTKAQVDGVTNWYKLHSDELVERSVPIGSKFYPTGCRIEYENGEVVRAFDGEENEISKESLPRLPLLSKINTTEREQKKEVPKETTPITEKITKEEIEETLRLLEDDTTYTPEQKKEIREQLSQIN